MTSPVSGPSGRRVLIVGADGLRPDLLDPERMPNVAGLIRDGVRFTDHHAAYPSHTRVNMSTLATGSAPGRHGIVANTMLVPGATEDHIIDTSNYQHLDALGAAPGASALLVRSLSDVLVDAGRRVAVAGTGSSGSNVLLTLNDRGRIVNTNSAYGIADLYDLREKLGDIPERATPALASNDYATSAVTDLYLDDPRNAVIVLWLAEPDSSLHKFGLGSPESEQAMASVDRCLGRILEAMDRRGIRDQFDVLFLSDHGHSTVRSHATLREYVGKARADLGSHLPDVATASDYIYARPGTSEPPAAELAPLVEWLYAQPWVDIVLAGRDEDAAILPGTIPLSELWGGATNGRRPLLAVSPVWDHSANEFGVPGSVSTLTTQSALRSSHGSLSPYDMHAVMIASGPSFRSGVATHLPTGATDVLPTILSLLDLPVPHTTSGRVLREAIATPCDDPGSHPETTLSTSSVGGRHRQIRLDHVGTTTYVHGSVTPSH
ncbi:MAG TPA: alkaline phosphatase family protein [Thermomicrobiales bacterium]|jgi:arylsulfatase A-like enzyme|nr:alkaline phosphatase family protein [Thermomicrobiales bacterium]